MRMTQVDREEASQDMRGRIALSVLAAGLLLVSLAACVASFDMSTERLAAPGVEWGIVIGSVFVQPEAVAPSGRSTGHDATGVTYVFDIVQIQPGDPDGEEPYAARYRLEAQPGVERMFISRLRPGHYLIKNFREDGMVGLGGELNAVFTVAGGEIRYVGRVHVTIPQRTSKGKGYRFAIENEREATLTQVARQYPAWKSTVVDAPMRIREPADRKE